MANLTRIKILTTGSTTTAPANIKSGELAYSYVAGTQTNNGDRLYIGTGAEDSGTGFVSNVDIIGGKYFTNLLDHVHGTVTNNSSVIVDGNKHIDQINIGSLALESSGGSGQVVTSIETSMPASPTDAQLITAQGVKEFIDTLDLGVTTDSGSIAIDLFGGAATAEETLTIAGTSNEIETSATGNVVTIGLPNSISVTTNLSVGGDLDVTGQTELASLNVEDLTNNRIVIAGADGEIEDDANLTFDGTTLSIGAGNFTVAQASGDTVIGGTLQVNGNVTLGNAAGDTVQTQGNLTVGGNLSVLGTTTSVNSTTTTLTDPVIELAKDTSAADGLDRGVRFKWHDGSSVLDGFFGLDIQTERFVFTKDEDLSGGDNASAPWSDAEFGNIYGTGADLGNIQVGITGDNEIDTTSGNLIIDSAGGTTTVDDNLVVSGTSTLTGAVTLSDGTGLTVAQGGTGVRSFTGKSFIISNNGGTALNYVVNTNAGVAGTILQFNAANEPIASNIIDGGTY